MGHHFIHIQLWYCVLILVHKSSEIIGISRGFVSTAAEVKKGGSEKKNAKSGGSLARSARFGSRTSNLHHN